MRAIAIARYGSTKLTMTTHFLKALRVNLVRLFCISTKAKITAKNIG
jgi:hypothetical protein